MNRFTLALESLPWWMFALWIALIQVMLIGIALAVNSLWAGLEPYLFLVGMYLLARYVYSDAVDRGMDRPGTWTALVIFVPIAGAFIYAARRGEFGLTSVR